MRAVVFYNGLGDCTTVLHRLYGQDGVHVDVVQAYELDANATAVYKHNYPDHLQPSCTDITTLLPAQLDTLQADVWLITPPLYAHTDTSASNDTTIGSVAAAVQYVVSLLSSMSHKPTHILIQHDTYTDCSAVVTALQQVDYNTQQHVLCSTKYGYPNARTHEYICAVQNSDTATSHLPSNSTSTPSSTIADYLDPPGTAANAHSATMNAYLQSQLRKHNFDTITSASNQSHIFTSQYGQMVDSAGSILSYSAGYMSLLTGQSVRFFSVDEIQAMLGREPLLYFDTLDMSEVIKYSLICSSANIAVLTDAISSLLSTPSHSASQTAALPVKSVDTQSTPEVFDLSLPFSFDDLSTLARLTEVDSVMSVDDTARLFSSIDPYTIHQKLLQLQSQLHSEGTDEQWIQCITCNNHVLVRAVASCYCNIPFEDDNIYNAVCEMLWLFVTIQPSAVGTLLFSNTHLMQTIMSQITADGAEEAVFARLRLLYFVLSSAADNQSMPVKEMIVLECMSQLLALIKHRNVYISGAASYCMLHLNTRHPVPSPGVPLLIYLYTVRAEAAGWSTLSQELVELMNTGCMHISQLQSPNDTRVISLHTAAASLQCVQQILTHATHQHDLPCMYTNDVFVLLRVIITHINEQSEKTQPLLLEFVQTIYCAVQWDEFKHKTDMHNDVRNTLLQLRRNSDGEQSQLCGMALEQLG